MFSYVCGTVYSLTQVLVQLYICQVCSSDYPQTDSVESCHLILWGRVSGNTCWSSTCQVAKAILDFPFFLSLLSNFGIIGLYHYDQFYLFVCSHSYIFLPVGLEMCIYMCTYTYKYVQTCTCICTHTWLPKVFYILSNHSTTKQQN